MPELDVKVAELEQRCKSNTHRIDKMEQRQDNLDKLVSSVASLAQEQEHIKEDVTEIKCDVKSLKEKPAKRWEAIVEKAILVVLSGLIGFLMSRLGIG